LAAYPTHRYAVLSILQRLKELWADEQGVPKDLADRINAAVSPHVDAVLGAGARPDVEAAVDDLVQSWEGLGLG
jgi:hypothetical protein